MKSAGQKGRGRRRGLPAADVAKTGTPQGSDRPTPRSRGAADSRDGEHRRFSLDWVTALLRAAGWVPDLMVSLTPEEGKAAAPIEASTLPAPTVIPIRTTAGEKDPGWNSRLADVLKEAEWQTCFTQTLTVPPREVAVNTPGGPLRDTAGYLWAFLRSLPARRRVVALVPGGVLSGRLAAPLRAVLATDYSVSGIVFLGQAAARALGAHERFSMALLFVGGLSADGTAAEKPSLLRVVNGTHVSLAECEGEIRSAFKRGGGEVGNSLVSREAALDDRPWVYGRFSKALTRARSESEGLGALRPLPEFVELLTTGVQRAFHNDAISLVPDAGVAPPGTVLLYDGRSLRRDGRLEGARFVIRRDMVAGPLFLQPGDVLIRAVRAPRERLVAVRARSEHAGATFSDSVLRLRFKQNVAPEAADLIVGYLCSPHVLPFVEAEGGDESVRLNMDLLQHLQVPDPSPEILQALSSLREAEETYRHWADDACEARVELFAQSSLRDSVSALLERERAEAERIQAARDTQSLEYVVRNHFPHPIALRWELAAQDEHGKARLEKTLECAEHLLTLLAFLGMVNLAEGHDASRRLPGRQLPSFCREEQLHLDWGKCIAIIREAGASVRHHPNPLQMPFPELADIATQLEDQGSPLAQAEHRFRIQRNNSSHLHRLPEPEIVELSQELSGRLGTVLEAVRFLGGVRLVCVDDYELNLATDTRRATYRVLRGVSPVFPRESAVVAQELPRRAVGALIRGNVFVPLTPWLLMEQCPKCRRDEIFAFNRYESGTVTWVAMESGHPHVKPDVADRFGAMVREATKPRIG